MRPSTFDFEKTLLGLGCLPNGGRTPGRLHRVGSRARISSRDRRHTVGHLIRDRGDGGWGPPQRFSDNPIWKAVETFVETLRTTSTHSRKRLGLAAQHSAERGAVNKAVNARN